MHFVGTINNAGKLHRSFARHQDDNWVLTPEY
jgi:hypothetical protein